MSEPAHEKHKIWRHQTSIDEIVEDVSKFINDPVKHLMSLLGKAWGNQRELRILVTGKTGQGKSTLINGILGDKMAEEGAGATRCTTTVTEFAKVIHSVPVKVFDSPGLQDRTQNEEEYIQGMRDQCKELSLVLYCTKMINHRLTDDDRNAMKKLTKAFGDKFWNYAVLVLTFANMEDCGKKDDRDEDIEEPDYDDDDKWHLLKKKRFECRLKKWENELKQFLIQEVGVNKKIAQRIPVVPTGDHVQSYNNRKPMCLPDRDDWFNKFWFACCLRVKDQKLFLEVNQDRIVVADDVDNSKAPKSEETEKVVATKELKQQQQQQQKQQQLKLEESEESKSNKESIENETIKRKFKEEETKHDETTNEGKKELKRFERKPSDKVKSWQKFEKEQQQQQQECPPENPQKKAKNTDFQKEQQKKRKNPPPIPPKPVLRRNKGQPSLESLKPQGESHTSEIENSTSDSLKMKQPSAFDESSLSVEGLSFQDTSSEPTSSDQITSTLDLTKPNSTTTVKAIEEEPNAMITSQTIQPTPGDQVTFQSSPLKTIEQDFSVTVLQEEPNMLPSVINIKDLPSESKSSQNSELTPSDQMSSSPPKLTKPNSTVPIDIVQEDPCIVSQDVACQAIQSIPSDQAISSSFLPTSDLNAPVEDETSISSQDTSQEPEPPSGDQITLSPTTNSSDLNSSSSSLPTLMNRKSKSFDQDHLADHKITMDKELVGKLVEETMWRNYGDAGADLAKKALSSMAKPVKWFVGLFKSNS